MVRVDSRMWCPRCERAPYTLYRVEGNGGVWMHRLWPSPAEGWTPPPQEPSNLVCPGCGVALQRQEVPGG